MPGDYTFGERAGNFAKGVVRDRIDQRSGKYKKKLNQLEGLLFDEEDEAAPTPRPSPFEAPGDTERRKQLFTNYLVQKMRGMRGF